MGAHQGAERTLLTWVRTGISLMVFGFIVARYGVSIRRSVHGGDTSALHGTAVGVLLIAMGSVVNGFATWRFVISFRAIARGEPVRPGLGGPMVVAIATIGLGVVVAVMVTSAYLTRFGD